VRLCFKRKGRVRQSGSNIFDLQILASSELRGIKANVKFGQGFSHQSILSCPYAFVPDRLASTPISVSLTGQSQFIKLYFYNKNEFLKEIYKGERRRENVGLKEQSNREHGNLDNRIEKGDIQMEEKNLA